MPFAITTTSHNIHTAASLLTIRLAHQKERITKLCLPLYCVTLYLRDCAKNIVTPTERKRERETQLRRVYVQRGHLSWKRKKSDLEIRACVFDVKIALGGGGGGGGGGGEVMFATKRRAAGDSMRIIRACRLKINCTLEVVKAFEDSFLLILKISWFLYIGKIFLFIVDKGIKIIWLGVFV